MHAEVLAIGDEITSGQTLDTNSQWLSQRLGELGIAVLYHSTVGDQLPACTEVFRHSIDRADVVVATGGLGPTADDLTREALAAAAGRPLEMAPDAMQYIRRMFARRNRPMPPQNQRQAMFPAGSRVVLNPHGTAPGIDLEVPREGRPACRVFCLPGVPAEMVEMWHASVGPAIAALLGDDRRIICQRRIHCFGAGESQIESMLPDLIGRGRAAHRRHHGQQGHDHAARRRRRTNARGVRGGDGADAGHDPPMFGHARLRRGGGPVGGRRRPAPA